MRITKTTANTLAVALGVLLTGGSVRLHAQPVIVEPGWALTRTVDFADGDRAHYNPVDGLLYVGRRIGANGLYRIEADGTATALWTGDECASVLVDPDDGDIFCSDGGSGEIFRTAFGSTGRLTWVAGFHSGDDDPGGMAIAPDSYAGDVVSVGDALVADSGWNGLDEIWRWFPDVPEGEQVVHADDGTLIAAYDVTFDDTDVYVVDNGEAATGIIYVVDAGGALTPLWPVRADQRPVGRCPRSRHR
jgi:hypothetical protein